MVELILLPPALFGVLVLFGVAIISPMRSGHRQVLLAASPVIGVAFLAVVLASTSWFLTAGIGIVVAVLIAMVVVSIGVFRGRASLRFGRSAWSFAAATWGMGALGAALALGPNIAIGDARVIMANGNHDAYYYASVAAWFSRSTLSSVPIVGTTPGDGLLLPAFAPAASAYTLPLRMGQPMVHGALTELVGSDVLVTTMPLMAVWVALVPAAAGVGFRLLRTGPAGALVGGLVTTSSALLIFLVVNQNMDSLVGISLAMMTLAGVVAAAQGRLPRWPAALILAALVACYTEYAVFVGPAILGGLLLRPFRSYRPSLVRASQVVALAMLMAPTAWLRGTRTLLFMAGGQSADTGSSPFAPDGDWMWALRILGLETVRPTATGGPLTALAALVLGSILVLGIGLSVFFDCNRGVWIGLVVAGGGYVAYLTASNSGYAQSRAVVLMLPLALMASTAGWAAFLGSRGRRRSPLPGRAVRPLLVLVLAVWLTGNVRTAHREVDLPFASERHVGGDFDEVRDWVAEVGGTDGTEVAVLIPDFIENMWINLSLRDFPLVDYPVESGNYVSVFRYGSGANDRYLVVGSGVGVSIDPSAIVRRNGTFMLIDRSVPGGAVVAPVDSSDWNLNVQAGYGFVGSYGASLLVLRSTETDPGPPPAVHLSAPHTPSPVPVELTSDGAAPIPADIEDPSSPVALPVGSTRDYIVVIGRPPGADPQARPSLAFQGFGDVP